MSSQVSAIPKGLHHLEVLSKNKFQNKWPSRLPHGPTQFVPSANRIKRWNVHPGDRVRLMVGKNEDKYLSAEKGAIGGWKVYTVKTVDMERNRVYINDYSNKKSATTRPRPENFSTMTAEEQRNWESANNVMPSSRPVHYSNVQLCVEENGPDSVFAARVTTSTPYFNKGKRRLEWDRYAAKLVGGPCTIAPDADRGLVRMDWPIKGDDVKMGEPSALDLASEIPSTFSIPPPSSLITHPLPTSATARMPPSPIPDAYLSPSSASAAGIAETSTIDALMPLHLSEELSPRFSRAKRTAGFNARRAERAEAVSAHASASVAAWEASGRDAALLSDPAVQAALGGVELEGSMRSRTRQEVRDAARAEALELDRRVAHGVKEAVKAGMKFNTETQVWEMADKADRTARKQRRKVLKADKVLRRMEGLKLGEGRNAVVPDSVRA